MHQLFQKLQKLLTIADKEGDSEELKRQHGFLIYMGLLMSLGGSVWGTICVYYEIYIAAIVPFSYITVTILNFTYLYYSKNFKFSQNLQIIISLFLPFFFQFFLGGFIASGGNVLWSVIAVFGSFTLRNKKMSLVWMGLFTALMIFSGLVDHYAKPYDVGLSNGYIIFFFVLNFIFVIAIIFSLYYYFVSTEEQARKALQESLHQLSLAQEQLIESEKMAALGSLVSGIAHEINTPLGVGLTGTSQLDHEIKKLKSDYEQESLTEDALLGFLELSQKLTHTVTDRLMHAAKLVKSFKNISIDQHMEEQHNFNLYQYFNNIIFGLQNQLKQKKIKVINQIPENIIFDSYPGLFSQILSNLLVNASLHAFDDDQDNHITLSLEKDKNNVILKFEDNGKGVSPEVEKKIFDPFFTTKRGQGGSGLGLHIIYNLITQRLKGKVETYRTNPQGLGFKIILESSIIKG